MTQISAEQLSLEAMTPEQVAAWLPQAMADYEAARIESGETPEQARAARAESEQRFFPEGRLIEGHLLFSAVLDGDEVGWLWLGPGTTDTGWWIWDIAVEERYRRRGVASRMLRLAESVAKAEGAVALGLNVFGGNDAAIALYRSAGFQTASFHLIKKL